MKIIASLSCTILAVDLMFLIIRYKQNVKHFNLNKSKHRYNYFETSCRCPAVPISILPSCSQWTVLFIAIFTQWPHFYLVISSCFVHSRVRDKLVVGLKQPRSQGLWDSRWQRQTYSCKKHGDITFMCACDGKTWKRVHWGQK